MNMLLCNLIQGFIQVLKFRPILLIGLDQTLDKIADIITKIKGPAVALIFFVALLIGGYNVFIGGQDKRSLVTTLLALMGFALLIFFADDLVKALSNFTR